MSIYDSGQCLGKNLMNAKEMPILKNSNSQLTLSKSSFSACLNSAERFPNTYC